MNFTQCRRNISGVIVNVRACRRGLSEGGRERRWLSADCLITHRTGLAAARLPAPNAEQRYDSYCSGCRERPHSVRINGTAHHGGGGADPAKRSEAHAGAVVTRPALRVVLGTI